MAERDKNEVGKWIGAFLAGSAVVSGFESCRSKKDEKKAEDAKKAQVPSLADLSLSSKDVSFSLLVSPQQALECVKSGSLSNLVAEFGSADGATFTYVFPTHQSATNAPSNITNAPSSLTSTNSPFAILRGVPAGPERAALLEGINAQGGHVQARIVQSVSGGGEVNQLVNQKTPWYYDVITPLIYAGAVVMLGRYLGKGLANLGGADLMGFGDGLQKFTERPEERFSDVGGNRTAVAEMQALAKEIERYQRGDARANLPRGILMSGDPGVGKTFLARVLCGEVLCPMVYVNAADLASSPFMGSWTAAVKRMFREARKLRDDPEQGLMDKMSASKDRKPVVVIFLDEFDSIGRTRNEAHGRSSDSEHIKAVNALLAEMDGVDGKKNAGIVIIAATNSAESIDPALKRPGRFTLQLKVPLPMTVDERFDILKKVAVRVAKQRKVAIDDETALRDLAKATGPISPDHLRGILDRGAELARRADRDSVTAHDLFTSLQEVMFGQAHDGMLTHEERRLQVAWHEHGHGLLAMACGCDPLVISMRPRGESLGRVVIDNHPLTEPAARRDDLLKALLILAGGRAGEVARSGVNGASAGVDHDFATMEKVARTLIDRGMLNGGFGGRNEEADFWSLPETLRLQIGNLCNHAILTARKVIDQVERSSLELAVRESLSMERELVGEEARRFYNAFVSDSDRQKIKEVVERFFSESEDLLATAGANGHKSA